MSETLKAYPGLYDKLKDRKTPNGVGLSDCMKTGVDNPGPRGERMLTTLIFLFSVRLLSVREVPPDPENN